MSDGYQTCSPEPQEFDLSSATSCRAVLVGLYNVYLALVSGQTRVRVRILDRWTDYARGSIPELRTLYTNNYNQCAAAGADLAGLPDLSPGNAVRRGPAHRGIRGPWPHL